MVFGAAVKYSVFICFFSVVCDTSIPLKCMCYSRTYIICIFILSYCTHSLHSKWMTVDQDYMTGNSKPIEIDKRRQHIHIKCVRLADSKPNRYRTIVCVFVSEIDRETVRERKDQIISVNP